MLFLDVVLLELPFGYLAAMEVVHGVALGVEGGDFGFDAHVYFFDLLLGDAGVVVVGKRTIAVVADSGENRDGCLSVHYGGFKLV